MYQVKDIDGKRLINGYEIAVVGNLCKVNDGNGTRDVKSLSSTVRTYHPDRSAVKPCWTLTQQQAR